MSADGGRQHSESAARLLSAMDAAGMDPMALATALGHKSTSTVYSWARGRSVPGSDALRSLCRALSTSADYLLGLTDDPTPPSARAAALPPTYPDRLSEAVDKRRKAGVGPDWTIHLKFHGLPGDEKRLRDFDGQTPPSQFVHALESVPAAERHNGIAPIELIMTEGLRELVESDPALTLGEARFLADAVNFRGGHHRSKHAKSAEFYRKLLEEVRAQMREAAD